MKPLLIIFFSLIFLGYNPVLGQELTEYTLTKEVNLSEYGYPVMLTCSLPENAEVIKEYDSYSIKLAKRLAIESITFYPKNDYDYNTKPHFFRSASGMLEDFINSFRRSSEFRNHEIVESYANGIYAIDSSSSRKYPLLVFYFESDEHVYEVKCKRSYPYKDEELKLLMDVIKSFKAIRYCFEEVSKHYPEDYIHDFSEVGYPFKIALPTDCKIENRKIREDYQLIDSDYDIKISEGKKYASVYQYHLLNEIDISLPKRKSELINSPNFIRMIYDDAYGYLAEVEPATSQEDRYIFYYYYRTAPYFYVFKSCFEYYGDTSPGRKRLETMSLELATEYYLRIKGIQFGSLCN